MIIRDVLLSRKTWVLWSLAYVNGWADVLTMLRYFAFATVMTGNSIYLVEAVARRCWHDVTVYVLLIICFALGVVTYRAITRAMNKTRWFRRRIKNWRVGPATIIAPLVLLMYLSADLAYYGGDNRGDKHFHCGKTPRAGVWGILPVTYAMGAVNSVSVTVDKTTTNSITGHILKVASITYDAVLNRFCRGAEVPAAAVQIEHLRRRPRAQRRLQLLLLPDGVVGLSGARARDSKRRVRSTSRRRQGPTLA